MEDAGTNEATARSIRALFDLPRYVLVAVERWAGWGRLRLVPRNTRFRCPECRLTVGEGHACRWRPLRDLDIGRRHVELRVQVYRIRCETCGRPEVPLPSLDRMLVVQGVLSSTSSD